MTILRRFSRYILLILGGALLAWLPLDVAGRPTTPTLFAQSLVGSNPASQVDPAYHREYAAQVLQLINVRRVEAGCQPLTLNNQLALAAQGHAADMAVHDFFSHTGSNGSTFIDRIVAAGYQPWQQVAENVAAGYATPEDVVGNWLNSPGHRANMLNCAYKDTGIGYYYLANDRGSTNYNHYWTQDFGVLQ